MDDPAQSAAHRGEGEEARKSRGRREERGQEAETGSSGKGRELSLLSLPSAGSLRKAEICTRWRGARAAGPRAPGASDLRLLQPAAGCETRTGSRGGDSVSKEAVPTRFAFSSPLLPEAGTRGI